MEGNIGFEVQFGNPKEGEALAELAAEEVTSPIESGYGFALPLRIFGQVQADLGVLHIGRYQHFGDDRVCNPGIGELIGYHFAQFFAQGFRNALGAVAIHIGLFLQCTKSSMQG